MLSLLWDWARNAMPDESIFFTVSISLAHSLTFWGAVFFYACIVPHLPGSDKWKITHGKPASSALILTSYKHCFFNHLVINPFMAYLLYGRAPISMSDALPSTFTIVWHLAACIILEDFAFYWVHRALHHRLVYGLVHKRHHEYKANVGIAAEHFHPVEDLFNLVPFLLGPILFKVHLSTFLLWMVIRMSEIVNSHSGYSLPFSPWEMCLSVQGGAERHEYHHSANIGCYGSFTKLWDKLGGTDTSYNEFLARKQQVKKA